MVFTLNIKTGGLAELQKTYGPDVVKDFIGQAIKKSVLVLEGEAKKEAPVDRGQLRAGFLTKFAPLQGILYNTNKHAPFVEFGTKPHTAPRDPIEKYARRKGLNPGALWWSIKRKGTKANDFLGRAIDKSDKQIDRILGTTTQFLLAKLNK